MVENPVAVALVALVVHVDELKGEAFVHLRVEEQPAVVHGVAEDRVQRQVVGAGAALVGGEDDERLRRPVGALRVALHVDLSDAGTGAADVAGRRVDQQVLAGAVAALLAGDLRRRQEAVPGELVHSVRPGAVRVRHEQGDVVAGVGDHAVDEQVADGAGDAPLGFRHHSLRGPGVAADAADVRLDRRECDSHCFPPLGWRPNGSAYETKRRGASTNYGDLAAAAKLLTKGRGVTRALQLEVRSGHGSIPQSSMVGTGFLGVNMPNGLRHPPMHSTVGRGRVSEGRWSSRGGSYWIVGRRAVPQQRQPNAPPLRGEALTMAELLPLALLLRQLLLRLARQLQLLVDSLLQAPAVLLRPLRLARLQHLVQEGVVVGAQ